MFFFGTKPEFTNGRIDLIPIHPGKPDPLLGFGQERVWRITEHGRRQEIGILSYRDGESECVYYYGHIGYHINETWRGHHYALEACRLIRSVILMSGKESVVITCDPDNLASRKTCERLGCTLERTVAVPLHIREHFDISKIKCRYLWRLDDTEEDGLC